VVVLNVLAAACAGGEGGVTSVLLDPAHPPPPRPAGAPVLLLSDVSPSCRGDTIGYVTVEGGGPLPSRELTNALSRAVRRMGGDAIVGLHRGARPTAPSDSARAAEARGAGVLSGTVVRFRDETCRR
jgi:hypothetical protein